MSMLDAYLVDPDVADAQRQFEVDALDVLIGATTTATTAEWLAEVEGLTRGRRETILAAFPTAATLTGASIEDLSALPGIGRATAARVHRALRR